MQNQPEDGAGLILPPPLTGAEALFLDFDGTLVELAATPAAVHVPHDLLPLLQVLSARHDGALAILSGRTLESIDTHLAPLRLPAGGVHGAELREQSGGPVRTTRVPAIAPLVAELRKRFGSDPCLVIEDKGAAAALHFRLAPQRSAECSAAMQELAHGAGLQMLGGNMVVEARMGSLNKGSAILELMARPPFLGRRPVFVGDDRTDEDGFLAVNDLGGDGVKVGKGTSAARYRMGSVGETLAWLQQHGAPRQQEPHDGKESARHSRQRASDAATG